MNYEVPRTRKGTHGQKIIMGRNADRNNYGAKQSHDVSGSESVQMDTPDVQTVLNAKNQVITELDIYPSETTGAVRVTPKKMYGAPNNTTTAYVSNFNKKRLSVAQMYPDRLKSYISKMMLAEWKKLSAA